MLSLRTCIDFSAHTHKPQPRYYATQYVFSATWPKLHAILLWFSRHARDQTGYAGFLNFGCIRIGCSKSILSFCMVQWQCSVDDKLM